MPVENLVNNVGCRVSPTNPAGSPPPGWPSQGCVVFANLTASYAWKGLEPALLDISVSIPGGSSCGFVGRSGSGKSTTVLALAGMIPIISGRCEIDGVDVRSVSLPSLRGAIAVVPQVRNIAVATMLCYSPQLSLA